MNHEDRSRYTQYIYQNSKGKSFLATECDERFIFGCEVLHDRMNTAEEIVAFCDLQLKAAMNLVKSGWIESLDEYDALHQVCERICRGIKGDVLNIEIQARALAPAHTVTVKCSVTVTGQNGNSVSDDIKTT